MSRRDDYDELVQFVFNPENCPLYKGTSIALFCKRRFFKVIEFQFTVENRERK